MIWSYQPHRACNPFFKLSQIVGYSGDWIDSICLIQVSLALFSKIQVLEDVGTLYSASWHY